MGRIKMNVFEKINDMIPDSYTRNARWYPTVLSTLPVSVLLAIIVTRYLNVQGYELLSDMLAVIVLLPFAACAAIYMLAGLVRDMGKQLENREFKKRTSLPTTEFLLWKDNELSNELKADIRDAITSDFGKVLLSPTEEMADEGRARKLIIEAVDLIRPRVKNGVRLLQYNTRYGFWRNFLASAKNMGMPSALVGIFLGLCWLDNRACVVIESVLLMIYLLLTMRTSAMMKWYGDEYARVLFSEYLEQRK